MFVFVFQLDVHKAGVCLNCKIMDSVDNGLKE